MTYTKKYEEHMSLNTASKTLNKTWGMDLACSRSDFRTEKAELGYLYDWLLTKGRVQIEGHPWETSNLEITVEADSEGDLRKICTLIERKIIKKTGLLRENHKL